MVSAMLDLFAASIPVLKGTAVLTFTPPTHPATPMPAAITTRVADSASEPITSTAPPTSAAITTTQASRPSVEPLPEGMPGDNVSKPSTLTALDVATGHQIWQTHPPMVYPTPISESGGTLELHGGVSPEKCSFFSALTTLDVVTGTFINGHIIYAQSVAEDMPPISDGTLTIQYVLDNSIPGTLTGLEAVDRATGSTLWRVVQPGASGPALLKPPLSGSGVIVAAVGGRNPISRGPATAIVFIDERTGITLWTTPGDAPVAIGAGMAYVLSAGSLEAHDIHTGASRWRQDTQAAQVSANDDVVVVSGAAGTVAYDTSGHQLWDVSLGLDTVGGYGNELLVGHDSVYVVTSPGGYKTDCSGG
jgi:outer membrane protein assembly factor BamB